MNLVNTLLLQCAGEKNLISTALVGLIKLLCFLFCCKIFFVKAYDCRNVCLFHHDQETVQQHEIRLWIVHCKNHKCLIYIGNCRADQGIFAGEDPGQVPLPFLFIQYCNLYIITNQRFLIILSENTLGFTFIKHFVLSVNIIKPGNSFDNFTLHELLCFLESQWIRTKLLEVSVNQL